MDCFLRTVFFKESQRMKLAFSLVAWWMKITLWSFLKVHMSVDSTCHSKLVSLSKSILVGLFLYLFLYFSLKNWQNIPVCKLSFSCSALLLPNCAVAVSNTAACVNSMVHPRGYYSIILSGFEWSTTSSEILAQFDNLLYMGITCWVSLPGALYAGRNMWRLPAEEVF